MEKKVIAQTLERHVSTIYRELKRNKGHQGYYYSKVHKFARGRRKDNGKQTIDIIASIWGYITYRLEEQWNPEKIRYFSGINHGHIYQFGYKSKVVISSLFAIHIIGDGVYSGQLQDN